MNILEQIVAAKYQEVKERKELYPVSVLGKSKYFSLQPGSLGNSLISEKSSGVIAEFKRMSPSKGIINNSASAGEVGKGYENARSSAISVLTNRKFFGGSLADLAEVRRVVKCPVLCKDFIVDEYQVIEARSAGADAVLLISDIHSPEKLDELYRFVISLGMEALIEVHDKIKIPDIPPDASLVGINSRNLATFKTSLDHALELADSLPGNVIKVAESGIRSADDYFALKKAGFNGFLIGEYFMSSREPAKTCRDFIESLRQVNRKIK